MPPDSTSSPPDARPYIDALLRRALDAAASDIHIEPTADGAHVRFRIDGLLQLADSLPLDIGRAAVLRLMVLAQLLTYRLDIPQEGRLTIPADPQSKIENQKSKIQTPLDLRLAIMPTAHGLRAVVRLPADLTQPKSLDHLGLPSSALTALHHFARSDAGMLLVTGPAGSGKTTTIYGLLEHIARQSPGLSIISLEDPVERLLSGVTQIEVTPHGQLTYERALKSILRQDPQVLMLGEIRDVASASIAVQAALSGHRLIATLHAGDPATAIARLLEMGIEPYQITSSLFGILTQRLVRKLAPSKSTPTVDDNPSIENQKSKIKNYHSRTPIAEFAALDSAARPAILGRADAEALRKIFGAANNHATMRAHADELVAQGITDAAEIRRVLGD